MTDKRKAHWYATDIAWGDSGEMLSWTPARCTCDRPWRHAHALGAGR